MSRGKVITGVPSKSINGKQDACFGTHATNFQLLVPSTLRLLKTKVGPEAQAQRLGALLALREWAQRGEGASGARRGGRRWAREVKAGEGCC